MAELNYCYVCNQPTPLKWWCNDITCRNVISTLYTRNDPRWVDYPSRKSPDAPGHPDIIKHPFTDLLLDIGI